MDALCVRKAYHGTPPFIPSFAFLRLGSRLHECENRTQEDAAAPLPSRPPVPDRMTALPCRFVHTTLLSSRPAVALRIVVDAPSPRTGTGSALLLDGPWRSVCLLVCLLVSASERRGSARR